MPEFNKEKAYKYKKDIQMTMIYNLSGIGNADTDLPLVKKEFNFGKNNDMSEAEMVFWIARERLLIEKGIVENMRGIGSLKAEKYQDSVEMVEDAIEAVQQYEKNRMAGIGSVNDIEEETGDNSSSCR